jgi:hypothetical protein
VLTAAIIGLALFAVLAAGVLALMAARRAAIRVLILASALAIVGAGRAIAGNRIYTSCQRDAANSSFDPVTGRQSGPDCETSHAFGLRDPF